MPRVQHIFFLILFGLVTVLMFFVLKPFLSALFVAASLAVISHPFYEMMLRKIGPKPTLAALITVAFVIVIVLIPVIGLSSLLFNEARNAYGTSAINGHTAVQQVTNVLQEYAHQISPSLNIDAGLYIQNGLRWVVSHLDSFFSSFLSILLELALIIVSLFYFIRDGGTLRKKIIDLSPLSNVHDERILQTLNRSISSVIKGSLIVSLIQSIFLAIGFALFGVPNAILWGALTVIAALIPGVGTSLVLVPGVLYLFYIHHVAQAIGLLIWGAFAVGLIDNALSPFIMKRGIKLHPLLILLSVLGGITFFGPVGFLIGPVLLSLFFALLDIYPLLVKDTPHESR